ncbi:hypothetical protein B0H63DRAFT_249026 [Podospora didyma]|uniref:Uncharacterized protein n=1 Tax=Podospora didyma TaxID=330526 RepID=A0AAE0KLV0_9PEZI|nr:hypothetical protein B0H63DRAFT_249026 [Podospora didyma]
MGGKVWSRDEEVVFWKQIVTQSPKRAGLDRLNAEKSWSSLATMMTRIMNANKKNPKEELRRNYTALGLFEHFFQNARNRNFSPNAHKFVTRHLQQEDKDALAEGRPPAYVLDAEERRKPRPARARNDPTKLSVTHVDPSSKIRKSLPKAARPTVKPAPALVSALEEEFPRRSNRFSGSVSDFMSREKSALDEEDDDDLEYYGHKDSRTTKSTNRQRNFDDVGNQGCDNRRPGKKGKEVDRGDGFGVDDNELGMLPPRCLTNGAYPGLDRGAGLNSNVIHPAWSRGAQVNSNGYALADDSISLPPYRRVDSNNPVLDRGARVNSNSYAPADDIDPRPYRSMSFYLNQLEGTPPTYRSNSHGYGHGNNMDSMARGDRVNTNSYGRDVGENSPLVRSNEYFSRPDRGSRSGGGRYDLDDESGLPPFRSINRSFGRFGDGYDLGGGNGEMLPANRSNSHNHGKLEEARVRGNNPNVSMEDGQSANRTSPYFSASNKGASNHPSGHYVRTEARLHNYRSSSDDLEKSNQETRNRINTLVLATETGQYYHHSDNDYRSSPHGTEAGTHYHRSNSGDLEKSGHEAQNHNNPVFGMEAGVPSPGNEAQDHSSTHVIGIVAAVSSHRNGSDTLVQSDNGTRDHHSSPHPAPNVRLLLDRAMTLTDDAAGHHSNGRTPGQEGHGMFVAQSSVQVPAVWACQDLLIDNGKDADADHDPDQDAEYDPDHMFGDEEDTEHDANRGAECDPDYDPDQTQ